ncbi:MAG: hypothetical protein M1837_004486 [Sclerophora amabilis]|nr:MAG: hypothetical protein M1837_004486 [Sclerophora amabilis]
MLTWIPMIKASGIGLAVAKSLIAKGWTICLIDINAAGQSAAEELGTTFFQADVSDYDSIASAFAKTWQKYGKLDFVFANAGISEPYLSFYQGGYEVAVDGIPPPPVPKCLRVNLDGVINTSYLAQHFFRRNGTPGGCLIMTASSASIYPVPTIPLYSASKHGVLGFMRSLAPVLRKENVRVDAILPGAVATNIMSAEEMAFVPKELFTSLDTVVDVVNKLLEDEKLYGQAVEISGTSHYTKEIQAYSDERAENIMRLWAANL